MQPISQNSKSILARALATENIRVEHSPNAKTAMFDTVNRVLVLPVWENASNEVYDMFVGHEVGHALFTPFREKDAKSKNPWIDEAEEIGGNIHASYVQGLFNIIEDVRIEKKIKDKFPGLRRDFSYGYRELVDRDFFGTAKKDISKFSFADRINLHFKCGAMMSVPFTNEEMEIVNMIDNVDTFDETLSAAEKLYKFISGRKESVDTPDTEGNIDLNNSFDSEGEDSDDGENININMNSDDQEGAEGNNNLSNNGAGNGLAPNTLPPIQTQSNFDKKQKEMISKSIYHSNYVTLPNPNVDEMILPWKNAQEILSRCYKISSSTPHSVATTLKQIRTNFDELIMNSKPLIGTLIKQFEMKKAADISKRTSVSRTGKIDADRLFKYKVSDDIFLRCAKIAEGKNHGMVMFVDWSASMQVSTEDVLTQIVMLTQFCRRMNIPFDVYLFSSQYIVLPNMASYDPYGSKKNKQYISNGFQNSHDRYGKREKENNHPTNLALIHVLSSEMKNQEFNQALFNVFTLGQMVTGNVLKTNSRSYRIIPDNFGQGNTPLDTTILAAMKIVPAFQEKHKIQIVNTIFLTDGEAGDSMFYVGDAAHRVTVVCPFNNKAYLVSENRGSTYATDSMLEIFKDVTHSNTIGFFISNSRYCRYIPSHSDGMKKVRSEGFYDCPKMDKVYGKMHGYDRLFILPNNQEITDVQENLESLNSGATITKIRNTFVKALEKRGASRSFLNRFADVIAVAPKR
jgi:hypothetical protein